MRRIFLTGVLLCLSLSLLPPAVAEPGVAYGLDQMAWGDWIELHGKKGTYTAAIANRYPTDSGIVTTAAILKGKCRVHRTKNFTVISCHGSGTGKKIPLQNFQLDPLMDSASLHVRANGHDNRVSWDGKGPTPIGGAGVASGGNWAAAGMDVSRDAEAGGRVLGRRVRSKGWLDWGFLYETAYAGATAGGWESADTIDGLDIDVAPDGTITVHRTYRIPR